ncbi:MAG: hypothetical protein IPG49_07785 [Proteobacteria bacterium]|nr:hypothetical protein [Pseudomonadota bacterium]
MNILRTMQGLAFAALPFLAVLLPASPATQCANRVDLDTGRRAARRGWSG